VVLRLPLFLVRQVNEPVSEVLIRGGTVVDSTGTKRADVLISGRRVSAVEEGILPPKGVLVLEADGCIVSPGLVDLHAHLREPGMEEAESIETATRQAALGGYTAVVAMPNTNPPIDSAAVVREVREIAKHAMAEVVPAGAITHARAGERLAPMAEMAKLGVTMFTDDGDPLQDPQLMRLALEYSVGLGVTIAQHCEDRFLANGGLVHEGAWSSKLGLPGVPSVAEETMVSRDILLAKVTGGRLHLLHLSTAGSIDLLVKAKKEGVTVSAEVTPHHISLTDASLVGYDPVFKVNPPLRDRRDVVALHQGLSSSVIDAIATDHAPHPPESKEVPFDQAAWGMIGLQTALAVALTVMGKKELPHVKDAAIDPSSFRSPGSSTGAGGDLVISSNVIGGQSVSPTRGAQIQVASPEQQLSFPELLSLMSWKPARIARLFPRHGGPVERGAWANLCVIDPYAKWTVEANDLASKSRNTPFNGMELMGKVRHTLFMGDPVVIDGIAQR